MFNSVSEARRYFFSTYRKMQNKEPLIEVEKELAELIAEHPEYEKYFKDEKYVDYVFEAGMINPFMHLSMHQAINEQIKTNRPQGITQLFAELSIKYQDSHQATHQLAEAMMGMMYEMAEQGQSYSDADYLNRLKRLL